MTVEGDLGDLSVASLIQAVCSERRRAGLRLRRHTEEGAIYFDDGEIVHAELGLLEGERAIYSFLTWDEGQFRMSRDIASASRTVRLQWNQLLMEGMRRLDERERGFQAEPRSADYEETHGAEERFEEGLLTLVSQLEQGMTRVDERKMRSRPTLVLSTLGELVNRVSAFSEMAPLADARTATLVKALIRVNERFQYARILRAESNRLSVQPAVGAYESWDGDENSRRFVFRQLVQSLIRILEEYFAFFGACFQSSARAGQWKETYQVFLADLGETAGRIEG